MKEYMTWREICPIILNALADGRPHKRRDLKKLPEKAENFDHGFGHYGDNSMTSYRAGWSLTLMNNAGLVENVDRGEWKISAKALEMTEDEIRQLLEEVSQQMSNTAMSKRRASTNKQSSLKKEIVMSPKVDNISPIIENIRKLVTLKNDGLISADVAMQGIEKALGIYEQPLH